MFRRSPKTIGLSLAILLWAGTPLGAWAEVQVEPDPAEVSPEPSPRGVESLLADRKMDPARDHLMPDLSAAWAIPAAELADRAKRLRDAAAPLGLTNLEGPAQAILLDENAGGLLDRARVSTRLAPELPAARAALARALLAEGQPGRAWTQLKLATEGIPDHLESRSWLGMVLWNLAWLTAFFAGAGIIFMALLEALPRLTRHLGVWFEEMPVPARLATFGTLLFLPAALGEGVLGVLLAALALAAAAGRGARHVALAIAAVLILIGLHPLMEKAAASRVALANGEAEVVAQQVERGLSSPVARERVWRNADRDPLAARALAMEARRRGLLAEADALYERLLVAESEAAPSDRENAATLASNAAGAKIALDLRPETVELLERAVEANPDDAALHFNLSQAYGAVVKIEDQNSSLKRAQAIDADRVAFLTQSFGPGQMADRPWVATGESAAKPRLSASAAAAALRKRIAPGRLGDGIGEASSGFVASLVAGLLLGWLFARVGTGEGDLRTRIKKLVENRSGDSADRIQRLSELRARESAVAKLERVGQVLLPGFAGLRADRPLLGALTIALAALGVCLVLFGAGPVPAPLSLGLWPQLVLPWVLVPVLLGYVALTGYAVLSSEQR